MFKEHTLRRLAVALCVAAAAVAVGAVVPALARAGATQTVETFTNEPAGFIAFEDPCTGQQVGGYEFDTGWIRTTETPSGTVDVHHVVATVDLYVVDVPPWDPSFTGFGPFVGTFTFPATFADSPASPNGASTDGFVESGQLTYPDGSSSHVLVHFRFVQPPNGPPRVFFVKAVCAG